MLRTVGREGERSGPILLGRLAGRSSWLWWWLWDFTHPYRSGLNTAFPQHGASYRAQHTPQGDARASLGSPQGEAHGSKQPVRSLFGKFYELGTLGVALLSHKENNLMLFCDTSSYFIYIFLYIYLLIFCLCKLLNWMNFYKFS